VLVLDSGAVTRLARRTRQNAATIAVLVREGLWPPIVPSVVLVEATSGRPGTDANTNRLLKTCDVVTELPESIARRAAALRHRARRGSAVDALLVAIAEPGNTILTGDADDLHALASHSNDVIIQAI
jgi:hypothetical protein